MMQRRVRIARDLHRQNLAKQRAERLWIVIGDALQIVLAANLVEGVENGRLDFNGYFILSALGPTRPGFSSRHLEAVAPAHESVCEI